LITCFTELFGQSGEKIKKIKNQNNKNKICKATPILYLERDLYPPVALIPQIGHTVIPITLGAYLYGITYSCQSFFGHDFEISKNFYFLEGPINFFKSFLL
jgi:hypothetical protein